MSSEDKRIEVEIELPEEKILELAMEAHRRDITLNDLCNEYLKNYIENYKE